MKNLAMTAFALLLISATSITAASTTTDALYFNKAQFMGKDVPTTLGERAYLQLTAPIVYSGSVGFNLWHRIAPDYGADCVVDLTKNSIPVYMTMCQPCFDCHPCSFIWLDSIYNMPPDIPYHNSHMPGIITRMNFYIVDINTKTKQCAILKVDLANNSGAQKSAFFTGAANQPAALTSESNRLAMFLAGPKNDFTFKYVDANLIKDLSEDGYSWVPTTPLKTGTAFIKSVASFTGELGYHYKLGDSGTGGAYMTGIIKMSRDANLTNYFLKKAFTTTVTTPIIRGWESCDSTTITKPNYCEYQFKGISQSGGADEFDQYLTDLLEKKGGEVELIKVDDFEELLESYMAEILGRLYTAGRPK